MKARWTHLYPYRTQKLSILTAKIVRKCENSKLPGDWYPYGYLFFIPFMIIIYISLIIKSRDINEFIRAITKINKFILKVKI